MSNPDDLRAAADRLRDAWLDACVGWQDESAVNFEIYYSTPLESEMTKVTSAAAEAIAEATAAVRAAGA